MKTNIFSSRIFSVILMFCILFGMFFGVAACDFFVDAQDDPYADMPPLYAPEVGVAEEAVEVIPVESVEIGIEHPIVERGDLIIPTVTFFPADATNQAYTLHTYDETILSKTEGGFIAISSGYAEIIVLAADGATAWTSVSVVVSVQRVSLNVRELTLNVGESSRVASSIFPADATYNSAQFWSSDASIATISQFGTIQALAAGSAEIVFSVDGVIARAYITVEIPVTGIDISVDREIFSVGEEGTFTVEFTPEDASNQTYEISFSEGAESAEDNTFTVTAAGEIEITVTTAGGFSASETITAVDLELLASEVFELTNAERVEAGLPALVNMRQLRRAAQTRSEEIIEYFSHTRPDGRSCFTVLSENNISYVIAGENIAMGQRTAPEVVAAWMNSPGHRENILRNDFSQLGIGVSMDSEGGLYWAQMFMD